MKKNCAIIGRCILGTILACMMLTFPVTAIQAAGTESLVLVGDADYPPLTYLREGEARGVIVDIMRELAQRMQRSPDIRLMEWEKALSLVTEGKAAAVGTMSINESRKKIFDFSDPIYNSRYYIFIRSGTLGITKLSDLRGHKVGVRAGGLNQKLVEAEPRITMYLMDDYLQGFQMLRDGKLDAIVADILIGAYILAKNKIPHIQHIGKPVAEMGSSFAVRKGNTALLNEINMALRSLKKDGTVDRIYSRWRPREVVFQTREQIQWKTYYWAIALFSTLLIISGIWIAVLRKEISQRRKTETMLQENKRRLQDKNEELEATNEELQAAMEELEATNDALLESGNQLAAANERLAEGETSYRTIIENMQDAFYRTDISGRLIMLSPSFARILGYETVEDCLGKNLAEDFYDNRSERQTLINLIHADGKVSDYEVQLRRRDGALIDVTTSSQFFYDRDGAIAGIEGVFRDISRRKRAEEALRESEERFRSLVETTSDCVWETGKHGVLTYLSPRVTELLGFKPEELIGKTPLETMPPDEARRVGPILADYAKSKRPFERLEHLSQHRDGRHVLVETSGVPFFDAGGKLLGYRGIDRDINERKAAEEALRESAERYRLLVSTSMDGFVVIDEKGHTIEANDAYCSAVGYTRDELREMDIPDIDFEDNLEKVLERNKRIFTNGSERFEARHRRKDGSIIDMDVSITLIRSTGHMLAFNRDITDHKRAEKELRESESRYRTLSEYHRQLNAIFIKFTEAKDINDLFRIIAKLYRQFIGARGVIVARYNDNDKSLTIVDSAGKAGDLPLIESRLGTSLLGLRIPVHATMKTVILSNNIQRTGSLEVITMGAISQEISDQIFEAIQCKEAIALAFHYGAEPVGTVVAFMQARGAGVPDDILLTFGQMAGLAVKRKQTEEEIIRLNAELEQMVAERTRALKGAYDELLREIDERKAVEEALRISKNRLNLITNNVLDLVSIISKDHTFMYASPSHRTVLGYEPDEFVGKPVADIMPPGDRDRIIALIDNILSSGLTGNIMIKIQNADGHYQWIEIFGSVLHNDDGEIIGIITSGRDITERYLLEMQLKLSENRFRKLFENSPVSLFELDLSESKAYLDELLDSGVGELEAFFEKNPDAVERCYSLIKIINFNSTAREIFHIDEIEGSLKELSSFIRQSIITLKGFISFMLGERTYDAESIIKYADGRTMHISLRISIAPGAEESWSRAIASVEDITRFKEMERDLKLARDSAEKANRAKSEFLANMSHELRTPLNAIIGFSQIIDMQLQEKSVEKLAEYLGYIKTSGEHLLNMVNDILDLSKIEAGRIELDIKQFNLRNTLISIPTHVKSLAMKKGLDVRLDLAPDLGIIRGDEVRIKQVIYNLLSNAIKFTESGKRIGISAHREGATAVITVWDEGIGIDEHNLTRIFQPFEQVDGAAKDTEGTGLGLAITMRLVQLHGGGIKVESSPGGGSKFTITLPGAFATEGNPENS